MDFRIVIAILICSISAACHAYIVDGSRVNQPRLLSFAKEKLQNKGILQQAANGSTFLKIADQYVYDLIRQVKAQGFEVPKTGALIDVTAPEEANQVRSLAEIGRTIDFEPLGFYTVVQDDQEYFMLAVAAPELSLLRKKYGLSEKLANHEFKLVIGVRKIQAHNELAP